MTRICLYITLILVCVLIYILKKINSSNEFFNNTTKNIVLIQQFYIPKIKYRYNEVKEVLKRNVENKYINKIILLNEQIYTGKELGIESNKIQQINLQKCLTYYNALDFMKKYRKSIFSREKKFKIIRIGFK